MSAPESLDQARRDGWDDDEDFFDESEGLPVDERVPDIEVVSDRVRDLVRRAA